MAVGMQNNVTYSSIKKQYSQVAENFRTQIFGTGWKGK